MTARRLRSHFSGCAQGKQNQNIITKLSPVLQLPLIYDGLVLVSFKQLSLRPEQLRVFLLAALEPGRSKGQNCERSHSRDAGSLGQGVTPWRSRAPERPLLSLRFWGSGGRRVVPGFLRGWRPSVWGLLCCHGHLTSVVGCPGQDGEGGPGTHPGVAMAGPLGHQPWAQAPGPAGPGKGASGPSRPSGPAVAPQASRHPDIGALALFPKRWGITWPWETTDPFGAARARDPCSILGAGLPAPWSNICSS